ncbi:GNAT family N-acetyltransferase [Agromyces sp. MMS24-JH15]|uniref:GNAT family N-acetyltransferase n=1 Tax=Agromyces sp. MMS24-JH15 TaxID=3243765 RepID=UPI00374800C1
MSAVVRPARPDEWPAVGALTERAFAAGPYGHLPVSAERRALVHAVGERAASGAVLVAESDRGLVGTVSLLRAGTPQSRLATGDEAELRLLAVDPAAGGRGLGRALASVAQEAALGWGASAVVLDTGTRNRTAQSLYDRLGYRVLDRASRTGEAGGAGGARGGGGAGDAERTPGTAPAGDRIDHVEYRLPLRERDDLVVRLVRDHEIAAVAALSLRAYEHDYDVSPTYRASILDVGERAREHQVWVATDASDGTLLGTVATPGRGATISPLARAGELDFRLLAVDPAARGRGVGAALTRHAIELARLRGLERVVMNSGPQMTGAHRLYGRLGFARLPEREHEISDGGRTFRLLAFSIDVPDAPVTIA